MKARGFTLVELLVVMALLALMCGLLFGAMRSTARTTALGTATLDRASDVAAAARFLRSAFADAKPLPVTDDSGDEVVSFEGNTDRVTLIGVPPPQLAQGGFDRIEIALDRKAHVLAARWTPLTRGDAQENDVAPPASDLLEQVARVEFDYFGAIDDETSPSWHDAWEDQRKLPSAVRLRIAFNDGTSAPDVLVAVRTAGGAAR